MTGSAQVTARAGLKRNLIQACQASASASASAESGSRGGGKRGYKARGNYRSSKPLQPLDAQCPSFAITSPSIVISAFQCWSTSAWCYDGLLRSHLLSKALKAAARTAYTITRHACHPKHSQLLPLLISLILFTTELKPSVRPSAMALHTCSEGTTSSRIQSGPSSTASRLQVLF
jgi:hypothetical protein